MDIGIIEEADQLFIRIRFLKLLQEIVAVDRAADMD